MGNSLQFSEYRGLTYWNLDNFLRKELIILVVQRELIDYECALCKNSPLGNDVGHVLLITLTRKNVEPSLHKEFVSPKSTYEYFIQSTQRSIRYSFMNPCTVTLQWHLYICYNSNPKIVLEPLRLNLSRSSPVEGKKCQTNIVKGKPCLTSS